MGYTNIISTIKLWYLHTKKLKYCSSEMFDEYKNKFCKGWSPGSELMLGTNISILPQLIIDLSYHPFFNDSIFEVNINFPPRGTTLDIVTEYCQHHNMS